MFDDSHQPYLDATLTQYIRSNFNGAVIANGGYDAQSGRKAILQAMQILLQTDGH